MTKLVVAPLCRRWVFGWRPSFGVQIILLYGLCTYVVPGILTVFVDVTPSLYRAATPENTAVGLLILSLGIAYLFASLRVHDTCSCSTDSTCFRLTFISPGLQLVILGSTFVIASVVYGQGLNDWRYQTESLSEVGSPLLFLYALAPVFLKFLLFVYIFFDYDFCHRWSVSHTLRKLLLCMGLVLTANGITALLFAGLAIIFFTAPGTIREFIFSNYDGKRTGSVGILSSKLRLLSVLLLGATGVSIAWVFGEGIKRGDIVSVFDTVKSSDFSTFIIDWFIGRISSSYVSLRVALQDFALSTDPDLIFNHLLAPLRSFFYRLDYLLLQPFGVERPPLGSMMRINYMNIALDPINPREGTSPGLFASFLLSLPLPANYLSLVAYLLVLQRFISRIGRGLCGQISIFGKMLFWPFLLVLFESPIDFLLIVDDSVFALVLVLWLAWRIRPQYCLESTLRGS